MTNEYRLYGPPGTGKTTWLAKKASEYAEMFGGDQVSVCSLTNAAVREAIGRDLPLDPDNTTTLHARCKRSMQAPPPAETKVREFAKEYHVTDHDFPRQLLNHSDIPSDEEDPIYIENLMSGSKQISNYEIANIYRQQMIPIDQWDMETRAWFKNWDRWMVETGNMDFTRWLEVARDIRPLPAQQAILVDEAQDHTPLQLAVIRNWNARNRILIGDDDQNLYEWAGALPEAFFEVDIPAKNERVLSQSYRVPRMVHAEASKLLGYLKRRHPKVYMPRDADGEFKRSNYTLLDAEIGSLPEDLLTNPDESYMILTSCAYMQIGRAHV